MNYDTLLTATLRRYTKDQKPSVSSMLYETSNSSQSVTKRACYAHNVEKFRKNKSQLPPGALLPGGEDWTLPRQSLHQRGGCGKKQQQQKKQQKAEEAENQGANQPKTAGGKWTA